jgi:hypothetical protein
MSAPTTEVYVRHLTVRLNVENAEDRVFGGRTYAPSRATVHYSGFFAPRGEMTGPFRKRDGTLGVSWVTERWTYEEAPEWLKAVVDAERPEWAAR